MKPKYLAFSTFLLTLLLPFSVDLSSASFTFAISDAHAQDSSRRVVRKVTTTTTTTTTNRRSAPEQTSYRRSRRRPVTSSVRYRTAAPVYRRSVYGGAVYGGPIYRTSVYNNYDSPYYGGRTYYRPNYIYYRSSAPVYRYVRRPRYVWTPYQEDIQQQEQNVYIYNNNRYIVNEEVNSETPELDCPRNTSIHRSAFKTWCATSRGTKHGPYITYYNNGQVQTEGNYEYGKRNGSWLEYFKDGGIRSEGSYLDGQRSGSWTNYDQNGEETTTVFYD